MGAKARRLTLNRENKAKRKTARKEVGKLRERLVKPNTRKRYREAVSGFLAWTQMLDYDVDEYEDLDNALADYVEHIYADGQPINHANDSLAGMGHFWPAASGKLRFSWKLCKQWQKEEPPNRATPFSPLVVLAMAGVAMAIGMEDMAARILLGFDVILRTGE